MWSTQAGSNLLLLASRINPAAENRRSTAVDVAGAVKYLDTEFDCGGQDTCIFHLLASATRATPAGPLATSDGSIFATRLGIPHLAGRRTVHCRPDPRQLCCCQPQLSVSTAEKFPIILLLLISVTSSCFSDFLRFATCCHDSSATSVVSTVTDDL